MMQKFKPFGQQQQKPVKQKEEKCKIKIKKTKTGKEISFSGKCSREQLRIAGNNVDSD